MIRSNLRHMLTYPLLGIVAVLSLHAAPVCASQLKDIRIGEYDGFTRIVFELDGPVSSQTITPQASGELVVTLGQTEVHLNRKIPVERSEHVRSIQFWHRRGNLTTRFQLDYSHFRFEYFPLTNPPRLALDVYPLIAQPKQATTIETRQDESQIRKIREATLPPAARAGAAREALSAASSGTPAAESNTADRLQPQTGIDASDAAASPSAGAQPAAQNPDSQPTIALRQENTETTEAQQPPKTNGIQFYLVIVLVAVTIVILALLLALLLTKRRWTDEADEMNVSQFLKYQDKRIASLNERIKEQFKRYEEAG